jgi:hypothetical protein
MQSFDCPNCGGSVPADGSAATVACPFCGNHLIVPEALRQAHTEVEARKAISTTGRWVIAILLLVIVVPTCLGLGASLLGAVVGILAPLFALVASGLFGP